MGAGAVVGAAGATCPVGPFRLAPLVAPALGTSWLVDPASVTSFGSAAAASPAPATAEPDAASGLAPIAASIEVPVSGFAAPAKLSTTSPDAPTAAPDVDPAALSAAVAMNGELASAAPPEAPAAAPPITPALDASAPIPPTNPKPMPT